MFLIWIIPILIYLLLWIFIKPYLFYEHFKQLKVTFLLWKILIISILILIPKLNVIVILLLLYYLFNNIYIKSNWKILFPDNKLTNFLSKEI